MEELWTELSQAWPAVKNNPEIAEKIEKLWEILKTSGNDQLQISKEIQSLMGNNNITSGFSQNVSTNPSLTNPTSIKAIDTTSDSLATVTQDDDIDSLLVEILGDDYKQEINNSASQTSIKEIRTEAGNNTEELDKLVASILDEDWLKEESGTTGSIIPSDDKQITKTVQGIDTSEISNLIFKADHNIDSLVSSIIANDSNEEIIKPTTTEVRAENQKFIDDNQDIDKLLNEILNEYDEDESLTTNTHTLPDNIYEPDINKTINEKPEEDIDALINDIINRDSNSENTISSLNSITDEENIDDLINDIINKDTDAVDTASSFSNITNEEDIDTLINDIINKDTDTVDTTYSLSNITNEEQAHTVESNPKEDIDALINDILSDKKETTISEEDELKEEEIVIAGVNENTSFQATDRGSPRKVTPVILNTEETRTSYKQPEKESSNILIIIILIILILGFIGAWMLFFNNEQRTQENITIQETYTDTTSTIEEDNHIVEEIKPKYTPKTYQYETEAEYIPSTIEPDSSVTSYYAPGETNNDITITLNTPETAIAENDSTTFNENETVTVIETATLEDDNINTIEKITGTTTPTETLSTNELILKESKIEKVKKAPPAKIISRRKVIIHVIAKGDTLWAIAKRYVNNPYRYPELARLSKIKNPNRIYPGNKVKIIVYIK